MRILREGRDTEPAGGNRDWPRLKANGARPALRAPIPSPRCSRQGSDFTVMHNRALDAHIFSNLQDAANGIMWSSPYFTVFPTVPISAVAIGYSPIYRESNYVRWRQRRRDGSRKAFLSRCILLRKHTRQTRCRRACPFHHVLFRVRREWSLTIAA
jgi:hypothetical protein